LAQQKKKKKKTDPTKTEFPANHSPKEFETCKPVGQGQNQSGLKKTREKQKGDPKSETRNKSNLGIGTSRKKSAVNTGKNQRRSRGSAQKEKTEKTKMAVKNA